MSEQEKINGISLNGYGSLQENLSDETTTDTSVSSGLSTRSNDEESLLSSHKPCEFESSTFDNGTATIVNETLNLVKNIVGSGGLSLPAGIAAFGHSPSAVIPSVFLIIIMGIVNAYSFSLLGYVCSITKSSTYQEAWDRTMGRRYEAHQQDRVSAIIGLVVTCKAFLGCWAFSIMIASTCHPLIRMLGWNDISQTDTLLLITGLLLLPLCMAEKLSYLAGFSFIGQIGTVVTAFTMALRYFDGSYTPDGKYFDDLPAYHKPVFADSSESLRSFLNPQFLILMSILSTGYVAHYNAPRYFAELRDHTTERFNVVVKFSFTFAAMTYMIISSLGFLTFGENSSGFILDNYSYRDPLATISRFGIALSVIFAYPLLFVGGRDGLLDLLQLLRNNSSSSSTDDSSSPHRDHHVVSLFILTVVTILAIFVPDLTFVLSFGGSTLSSAIIYVFPPLMFRALQLNCTCYQSKNSTKQLNLAMAMLYVGLVLGLCGAVMSILRTFFGFK